MFCIMHLFHSNQCLWKVQNSKYSVSNRICLQATLLKGIFVDAIPSLIHSGSLMFKKTKFVGLTELPERVMLILVNNFGHKTSTKNLFG